MTMKEPSTRQWRAIEYLSNFSFRLEYIKGEDNVLADLLSRCTKEEIHDIEALPPTTSEKTLVKKNVLSTRDINNGTTQVNILSVTIPVRELVEEQKKDPTLLTQKDTSSLNLTKTKDEIVIDISQGTPRILLPLKFRHNEFKRIHQFSHPGAKPTIELMRVRYVWPKMRKDIRSWCRECTDCQKSKVTRHTKASLAHIQTTGRFKNVHIDIVGPLPPVDGKRFILTMIDRATSWVEAIPLNEITANAVTTTFNNVWVSRFGPPETIISDQGLQFESNRFNEYCQDMGIEHNRTTAYHPQSNGKVERWHRALKNSLRCYSTDANKTWSRDLPTVLLGLRNCVTSDGKASATQMAFGTMTRLPGDILLTFLERKDEPDCFRCIESQTKRFEEMGQARPMPHKPFIPEELRRCSKVWMRREQRSGLQSIYEGPYDVNERSEDLKTFKIHINDAIKTVSIDRLKPAFVPSI